MLAMTYGVEKFHHYTFGRKVHVVTHDHKPLAAIASKPLSKSPKRLQSVLLRAQMYNFELHYEPGTLIPVADALFRAPLNCNNDDDHETINNLTYNPVKAKQMNQIKEASKDDEKMNMLMQMITTGWPEHKDKG